MDLSGFSHYEVKDANGNTRRGSYHDKLGRGFVMYQEGRRPEAFLATGDNAAWYQNSHRSLGTFECEIDALFELSKYIGEE